MVHWAIWAKPVTVCSSLTTPSTVTRHEIEPEPVFCTFMFHPRIESAALVFTR